MAQFIGVRCQEVEVVDPDSMFKFIKMDPPQADLNYSIFNLQYSIFDLRHLPGADFSMASAVAGQISFLSPGNPFQYLR
jgi:hypothetical protein